MVEAEKFSDHPRNLNQCT